jgi:nucleotide-binding universal stress UspA family protein
MKNILVPSDFSACANYAVKAALQLCRDFGANLHLYHVMDMPQNWNEFDEKQKNAYPEVKKEIQRGHSSFSKWKELASKQGTKIRIIFSGGTLLSSITEYIEKTNIDFIAMGSHGSSGKSEYFIGSNTQKVVRMVHIPVLILKDDFKKLSFKKIIFASGFNKKDQKVFRFFLSFISRYRPELHLLSINTVGYWSQPSIIIKAAMKDYQKIARPLNSQIHYYRDINVEKGIRHFVNAIEADLIAISNRSKKPIKRMFFGSTVEALVNHANVPVLSIDYKKQVTF